MLRNLTPFKALLWHTPSILLSNWNIDVNFGVYFTRLLFGNLVIVHHLRWRFFRKLSVLFYNYFLYMFQTFVGRLWDKAVVVPYSCLMPTKTKN